MNGASTMDAMSDHDDPEHARAVHANAIERAARVYDRARLNAEQAKEHMYATWQVAHGRRRDGRLSYGEIAACAGKSRQRVIQVVQMRLGDT